MINIKILFVSSLCIISFVVLAKDLARGTVLKAKIVKEKWGSDKLDITKFKMSDETIRAKMAYAILSDKSLIGKDVTYIRENFGQPDGYYMTDAFPAYFIQSGKNHNEESWQIVFTLDTKYKVNKIFVHKNCCDK